MKYLLDTDHASALVIGAGRDYRRMSREPAGSFAASVISLHEQTIGIHGMLNRARRTSDLIQGYTRLRAIGEVYCRFTVLPFDPPAAARYADLRKRFPNWPGAMDLRVAAVAPANGLTLLTRNTADFAPAPGLRVEDWTGP